MKILYLITKSEAGGAQTHVAEISHFFRNRGYDIVVMSRSGGWLEQECARAGVTFVHNDFFGNRADPITIARAIHTIRKCVGSFRPDIVHCHSSAAAIMGRLAIRGKIRTIYTAHGWGFNIGVSWWVKYPILFLEKWCASYTDTYLCVSKFVKQLAVQYGVAPEEKMRVVYNGIASMPCDRIYDEDERVHVVCAGRLDPPKKPELLLEALRQCAPEMRKNIKVTIVGGGAKMDMLRTIMPIVGAEVECTGSLPHDEVMRRLCAADISVCLSQWEGFPYSILESFSCGVPVIASNVGGVSEIVTEKNGILVDNDVESVKHALEYLVQNRTVRRTMGAAGQRVVQTVFSLEKMLTDIERVYQNV